jgi:hypothetical protein
MSSARRRAFCVLLAMLTACSPGEGASDRGLGPRTERPELLLLTSLPLAFGESFSIEATGSPVLDALEQRYQVRPIATASADALKGSRLLLMAQPLAQPAEDLVALDRWVRDGGRLLLLADPMLEWNDSRPLGDATRPPPMFADTGLLSHWGLRLDAPDVRAERSANLGGRPMTVRSAGSLQGKCEISTDRLVARCAIGKGTALIVADADFIDWSRGHAADAGQAALLAALDGLERD